MRAKQLPKLYSDKAKRIDGRYHGTALTEKGPVERKLDSLGDLQSLVLGQFGEGSQQLHGLLEKLANLRAEGQSRSIGQPVSSQERALFLHHIRRRLSITAVRAQAQCLLAKTGHLSQGAREAAGRRRVVREQAERAREDRAVHWEALFRDH